MNFNEFEKLIETKTYFSYFTFSRKEIDLILNVIH